jgi:hypothetical protein
VAVAVAVAVGEAAVREGGEVEVVHLETVWVEAKVQ